MVIEIVDLPIEHGDFHIVFLSVYQRVSMTTAGSLPAEKSDLRASEAVYLELSEHCSRPFVAFGLAETEVYLGIPTKKCTV